MDAWKAGKEEFEFESSGTTGIFKTLKFNREQIIWSCGQTKKLLNIQNSDKQICILPVNKTGGKMQVFRSLVWGIPIRVEEPDYVFDEFTTESGINIVSLTPLMLWRILQQDNGKKILGKFRHILIGGGDFQFVINLTDFPETSFYHTYGMTESLSHIAVKRIGIDKGFRLLEGTEIRKNDADDTLEFRNILTSNQWLKTNDIIEFNSDVEFVIKGRADNIINSGGVKINPETIERIIQETLDLPVNSFFVFGSKDEKLGDMLTLAYDSSQIAMPEIEKLSFEFAYLRPKQIIPIDGFIVNESNKINRKLTLKKINNF